MLYGGEEDHQHFDKSLTNRSAMLEFFRKIRQQLLSENSFSKYLFYAIGEIILVVIGILLALQINNWNEDRKATNRVGKFLADPL